MKKIIIIMILIPNLAFAGKAEIGATMQAREAIVITSEPIAIEGVSEIQDNEVIYL